MITDIRSPYMVGDRVYSHIITDGPRTGLTVTRVGSIASFLEAFKSVASAEDRLRVEVLFIGGAHAVDVVHGPEAQPADMAAGCALVAEARASMVGVSLSPWKYGAASQLLYQDIGPNGEAIADVMNNNRWRDGPFLAAARALVPQLTDAYAAALDELEGLRSRNAKLEAVMPGLRRCAGGICEPPCSRVATRVHYDLVYCDVHASDECADLDYAAALRALEEP